MKEYLTVLVLAIVVSGILMFLVTGQLWQFCPVAAAVWLFGMYKKHGGTR